MTTNAESIDRTACGVANDDVALVANDDVALEANDDVALRGTKAEGVGDKLDGGVPWDGGGTVGPEERTGWIRGGYTTVVEIQQPVRSS